MGKKYLDTKQNTIEAAVLDVWVDSAEEQKAIRSAARMVVGAPEFEEQVKQSPDSEQEKWRKKKTPKPPRRCPGALGGKRDEYDDTYGGP